MYRIANHMLKEKLVIGEKVVGTMYMVCQKDVAELARIKQRKTAQAYKHITEKMVDASLARFAGAKYDEIKNMIFTSKKIEFGKRVEFLWDISTKGGKNVFVDADMFGWIVYRINKMQRKSPPRWFVITGEFSIPCVCVMVDEEIVAALAIIEIDSDES